MKRFVAIASLVAALAILGGCAVDGPRTGSITLSIPAEYFSSASSRGLAWTVNKTESPNAVRIIIGLNGAYIQTETGNYIEAAMSANATDAQRTITIDALPPSTGYMVHIAVGLKSGQDWTTVYYGSTDGFAVSAGVDSKPAIATWLSPFATVPSDGPYVAVVGGKAYTIEGGRLLGGDTALDLATLLPGYTVKSLCAGLWHNGSGGFAEELWLVTDKGIVPYRGGAFITGFTSGNFGSSAVAAGALTFDYEGALYMIVYALGEGKDISVAYSADVPANVATAGIADWPVFVFETWLQGSDAASFRSFLEGITSDIVRSIDLHRDAAGLVSYGYLVSPLGLMLFNSDLEDAVDANAADPTGWASGLLVSNPYAIDAKVGTASIAVTAAASGGNTLYAATAKGLFVASINANGKPTESLSRISATADWAIAELAAGVFDGQSYAAALGTDGSLLVFKGKSVAIKNSRDMRYPFFSGMPDSPSSLSFAQIGNELVLLIAGEGGIAKLTVASY